MYVGNLCWVLVLCGCVWCMYLVCCVSTGYVFGVHVYQCTGVDKSRLTVVCETQFILVLLFINNRVLFHLHNCEPTFAYPCIQMHLHIIGIWETKTNNSSTKRIYPSNILSPKEASLQ